MLICLVTPRGSIRRYAKVPITPKIAPVVSGLQRLIKRDWRSDAALIFAGTGFAIGVEFLPHFMAMIAMTERTRRVTRRAPP